MLDARALAEAARGCDIVISDRQTAGPAEFFAKRPTSSPSCAWRSISAISTSKPASAQGVLVTHATPGFTASVAEMAIGFMIDCGRHVSEAAAVYHAGRAAAGAHGPPAQRRDASASSAMA